MKQNLPLPDDIIQTARYRNRKLLPYQQLALAVILEAFGDLQRALEDDWYSIGRISKKHTREQSSLKNLDEWFTDTASWWCEVAGMDHALFMAAYKKIRYRKVDERRE